MAFTHSSVIVTGAVVDTRTRDQLSFPFTARPQALTIYVQFVELGSVQLGSSVAPRVVSLSDPAVAGFSLLQIVGLTGGYSIQLYRDGAFLAGSNLAVSPAYGDRVELRGTMTAAGVIQLHQSIASAPEISASASGPNVLPQTWTSTKVWYNGSNGSNNGFIGIRNVHIVAGLKTMQEMRVWAGTD